MRLAIWSTTTPRENSTHQELFRRQLEETELAERIGGGSGIRFSILSRFGRSSDGGPDG